MNRYETMSDSYLKETYVPDIYQKTVYAIDYHKLKQAGIKLISFDIDDTIAKMEEYNPPKDTVILIEKLRKMGFEVVLMSNNIDENRVRHFGEKLRIDYIAHAHKPSSETFEQFQEKYLQKYGTALSPVQMAHIGNNIINDVGGGNTFGVTTALVRRMGNLAKPFHIHDDAHKLRKVLKERNIWRKHHMYERHDQYYQLEEMPLYRKR